MRIEIITRQQWFTLAPYGTVESKKPLKDNLQ